MNNKKLKAFTLAEMIVVLIVASIVIAMGFVILDLVRKQVFLIQRNYQKKQEVQFFEVTLTRDFKTRNAYYYKSQNRLSLKNTKDSISYVFTDTTIIREKDTFQIEVSNKMLFLDGKETFSKTIDALGIKLSENYGGKELFISQRKDAAFYIND